MVKKRSKHGINTGNTFHFGLNLCHAKQYATDQFAVFKFYPDLLEAPEREREVIKELNNSLGKYVKDGDIHAKCGPVDNRHWWRQANSNSSDICNSMNKQKRWLLPEMLKHAVDELHEDSIATGDQSSATAARPDVRLTMAERKTSSCTKVSRYSGCHAILDADCVRYHDSTLEECHRQPRKRTYAFASDLKKAMKLKEMTAKRKAEDEEKAEKEKQARCNRRHNVHWRGVQRHQRPVPRPEQGAGQEDENRWVFLAHPPDRGDGDSNDNTSDSKTIHYEICYPQPLISHKRCTHKNDYWQGDKRSVKSKGAFNKACRFKGYQKADLINLRTGHWQDELDIRDTFETDLWETGDNTEDRRNKELVFEFDETKISAGRPARSKRKRRKKVLKEDICQHPNTACSNTITWHGKRTFITVQPLDSLGTTNLSADSGSDSGYSDSSLLDSGSPRFFPPCAFSHEPRLEHRAVVSRAKKVHTKTQARETFATTRKEDSVRCYIKKESLQPTFLEREFGNAYQEANSTPRRFSIKLATEGTHDGYLLFHIVNGYTKDRLQPVRITVKTSTYFPSIDYKLQSITAAKVISVNYLLDGVNLVEENNAVIAGKTLRTSSFEHLQDAAGLMTKAYTVQEAYNEVDGLTLLPEGLSRQDSTFSTEGDFDDEVCQICFDDVSPRGRQGTALKRCQHWFCDECWRLHLVARLQQGDVKLTCPGFKCQNPVDQTTLLSLICYEDYTKWINRFRDRTLETSRQWQWCPNKTCGRLVKLEYLVKLNKGLANDDNTCVECECGQIWCFGCQEEVHYPATCDQAVPYHKKVEQLGEDSGIPSEEKIHYVDVKKCPKCRYPLEKGGGCQHMICSRCQHSFCWECLNSWSSHGTFLRCPTSKRETTAVDLEGSNMVTIREFYYKTAIGHRHLRKQRREKLYGELHTLALKIMIAQNGRPDPRQLIKLQPNHGSKSEKDILIRAAEFTLQVHFMLEYVAVFSSNCSRKLLNLGIKHNTSRLEFMLSRIEEILHKRPERRKLPELILQVQAWEHLAKGVMSQIHRRLSNTQTKLRRRTS